MGSDQMGTLKGFPNPPAMVRRRQSRRAPHAISVLLCLLCATLLAGACADFQRGPAPDASADGASELVNDPVFVNDVYPILQSDCQSCHSQGSGNDAETTRFVLTGDAKADRAMIVALVSPDDPDGSLLLQRAVGNGAHGGGPVLAVDSPEYVTIRNWIASLPPTP
jgi:hypothetical protein